MTSPITADQFALALEALDHGALPSRPRDAEDAADLAFAARLMKLRSPTGVPALAPWLAPDLVANGLVSGKSHEDGRMTVLAGALAQRFRHPIPATAAGASAERAGSGARGLHGRQSRTEMATLAGLLVLGAIAVLGAWEIAQRAKPEGPQRPPPSLPLGPESTPRTGPVTPRVVAVVPLENGTEEPYPGPTDKPYPGPSDIAPTAGQPTTGPSAPAAPATPVATDPDGAYPGPDPATAPADRSTSTAVRSGDATLPPRATVVLPTAPPTQVGPPVTPTEAPIPTSTLDWSPGATVTAFPTPTGGIPTYVPIPTSTAIPFPTYTPGAITWTGFRQAPGDGPVGRGSEAGPDAQTSAATSPWTAELGGFNGVFDIVALSPTEAWGAGSNIARFDGSEWRAIDARELPASFTAISIASDGGGWAVGYGSAVPIAPGGTLGPEEELPGLVLRDVKALPGGEAWAVGSDQIQSAVVVRREGDTWVRAWSGPTHTWLSGLWQAPDSQLWAVGGYVGGVDGGFVVRYDGSEWTTTGLPGPFSLEAISGTSPEDVWAVGGHQLGLFDEDPGRRVILHWDGTGWEVAMDERQPGLADVVVWEGGGTALAQSGELLELEANGAWQETGVRVRADPIRGPASALSLVPGTSSLLVATDEGDVYRVNGTEVTTEWLGMFARVDALAMVDSTLGWALRWGARREALRYDGSVWSVLADGDPLHSARHIASAPDGSVWAVGDGGLVMRFGADGWQRVETPFGDQLTWVDVADDGTAWMLGETAGDDTEGKARVLRYQSGSWQTLWELPAGALSIISATGPDSAWVATTTGVWHYDGADWARVWTERPLALEMLSDESGWAGTSGEIYAYDGRSWSMVADLPAGAQVNHIAARPDGTAWAAAWYGLVLHFDGSSWSIVRGSPNPAEDYGVPYAMHTISIAADASGDEIIWAAGEPASILRARVSDVLASPPRTPPPMPSPPFGPEPTATVTPASGKLHQLLFPAILNRPPARFDGCGEGAGASVGLVDRSARAAARLYTSGGPSPAPDLVLIEALSVRRAEERHGVDLVGLSAGGQVLAPDDCIWWATFSGRFHCECDPGPGYAWARLGLGLAASDGTAFYALFEDRVGLPARP